MGKEKAGEILVWTTEEYLQFSNAIKDRPASFIAFEILYWCGLRVGELLALTPSDFDFNENVMNITKSYQRLGGEDVITPPKTDKSIRKVLLPDFLSKEILQYITDFCGLDRDERIFPFTKSYLRHEMCRGCTASGVNRIKLHGLRHSHISLLADLGVPLVAIADRVGHENTDMTFQYAHTFPKTQKKLIEQLDLLCSNHL